MMTNSAALWLADGRLLHAKVIFCPAQHLQSLAHEVGPLTGGWVSWFMSLAFGGKHISHAILGIRPTIFGWGVKTSSFHHGPVLSRVRTC